MLKPFFSYFGSKYRIAHRYPNPRYDLIVEPFAGSAGYSLLYFDKAVLLVDASELIIGLWQYLIDVKESEIRKLPVNILEIEGIQVCQEAKWLIGFWITQAQSTPSPRAWGFHARRFGWNEAIRDRVAGQLQYIRHWVARQGSYERILNSPATWYVDPPYEKAGKRYKNRITDYKQLGDWCKTREGQVIVCEAEGARWLPFKPMLSNLNGSGKFYKEILWTSNKG